MSTGALLSSSVGRVVGRVAPCPCRSLRQGNPHRALRTLCALSLERPSEARKKAAPVQASAIAVVETAVSQEVQAAYEAGYEAGLAAARNAQDGDAQQPRQPDSIARSLVKALSWRFFSTATTIVLTITFFNATLDEAMEMGAAEFVSKYILYLIHERLWILVTLF